MVFETFDAIYRGAWKNALNSSESTYTSIRNVWMSVLIRYDLSIIQKAVQKIYDTDDFKKFPPTVIEFNLLCKNIQKRQQDDEKSKKNIR